MKKKYKRILIIILIVVLLAIISFVIYKILLNNKTEEEVVNVVGSISEYGYNLDDRDTELMKSTYEELKNILNSDEIDYELYASALAKLFVIDLFTMDNKINKYDVGSTEYVYPDALENFKLNVEHTLYKHMENNSSAKRKQDLPEVSSIEVLSTETGEYTIEENSFDSYIVNLSWQYVSDLGYDTIPEDMYLVLGDNREDSLDSRDIGLISKDSVNGKIVLRIWPINKISLF